MVHEGRFRLIMLLFMLTIVVAVRPVDAQSFPVFWQKNSDGTNDLLDGNGQRKVGEGYLDIMYSKISLSESLTDLQVEIVVNASIAEVSNDGSLVVLWGVFLDVDQKNSTVLFGSLLFNDIGSDYLLGIWFERGEFREELCRLSHDTRIRINWAVKENTLKFYCPLAALDFPDSVDFVVAAVKYASGDSFQRPLLFDKAPNTGHHTFPLRKYANAVVSLQGSEDLIKKAEFEGRTIGLEPAREAFQRAHDALANCNYAEASVLALQAAAIASKATRPLSQSLTQQAAIFVSVSVVVVALFFLRNRMKKRFRARDRNRSFRNRGRLIGVCNIYESIRTRNSMQQTFSSQRNLTA